MNGVFDDCVMTPVTRRVLDALRAADKRDPLVPAEMTATLDRSYVRLDRWMTGRSQAANERFGLADCAAAPTLFYAHWACPIPQTYRSLLAYRARLLARPSVARVIDEARPWRESFPLKGPDTD